MHAWRTPAPGILQRNTCHNYVHSCYPCIAICHCAHALFLSLGIHGMPLAFSTAEQLCIPGAAYRAGKSVCQRPRVRLHNLPRSQQAAGLKWIVFCVNFVYFFQHGLRITDTVTPCSCWTAVDCFEMHTWSVIQRGAATSFHKHMYLCTHDLYMSMVRLIFVQFTIFVVRMTRQFCRPVIIDIVSAQYRDTNWFTSTAIVVANLFLGFNSDHMPLINLLIHRGVQSRSLLLRIVQALLHVLQVVWISKGSICFLQV